jgi:hypothetical protein
MLIEKRARQEIAVLVDHIPTFLKLPVGRIHVLDVMGSWIDHYSCSNRRKNFQHMSDKYKL